MDSNEKDVNGIDKEYLERRFDRIELRQDHALQTKLQLAQSMERLSRDLTMAIDNLCESLNDFKLTFKEAVPLRIVVIMLSAMAAWTLGTRALSVLLQ